MKQLSGLDAAFLALESDAAPMLIGGVSLLDAAGEERLDVHRFRDLLRRRLDRAVAFRRRLAGLPLDLARPYWVEVDPGEVDLEHHVERTELPAPGGWHELAELAAFEMARPLDRRRPLWQMVFVEGVDGIEGVPEGAVALVTRVHHAAIDGVSGAEILAALFDGMEDVSGGAPAAGGGPDGGSREGVLDLLESAGRDLATLPARLSKTAARSLLGLAAGGVARLRGAAQPLPFTAPRTPLNRAIGDRRSWAPAFFALDRVKAIKNRADATVNDVVLALSAGALRGWLEERDALPDEPLVAMVPVSVRAPDQAGAAGNQVSAMLVSLATDEPDPAARLERIRDAARAAKRSLGAVGARSLVESADLLPFALSGLGVRLYTRLHLAERRPPFNLVITNVPGPPRPLTVGGARLLAHAGSAPVFDGLGLILPVFSYAGTVSVGVTADRGVMPDAAGFARRIEGALEELEGVV